MAEHTPTPWRDDHERILGETGDPVCIITAPSTDGTEAIDWPISGRVPTEDDITADANAAYIVRAANAYPAMLEALELAVRYLRHPDVVALPFALSSEAAADRAHAAIAQAKEGS